MSSEESSDGEDFSAGSEDEGSSQRVGFLRVRYHAWRSARLRRLYQVIDAADEVNQAQKRPRGRGRKERRIGLPKEGNPPPPVNTPRWMVSKKWQKEIKASASPLAAVLDPILKDDDEATLQRLAVLGPESDEDDSPGHAHPSGETDHSPHEVSQSFPHHFLEQMQYWPPDLSTTGFPFGHGPTL